MMFLGISIVIILALFIAFYMAWNIGANDVANSMSTAVGSRAITVRQAVVIAAVLEAAGAILVGATVAQTVKSGVVSPAEFETNVFIMGSLSAILAASIWITIATWKGMPISTTHSIIGALIGFGLVAKGPGAVGWSTVGQIAISWVISPLVAGAIAFLIFKIIVKGIFHQDDPKKAASRIGPIFLFSTMLLIFASTFMKTPLGDRLGLGGRDDLAMALAILCAFLISLATYKRILNPRFVEKEKLGDYAEVEAVFRNLQIVTACYIAFAHGANDVANAIGPVAGVIYASGGIIGDTAAIPIYLLVIGGVGIAVGVLTWGHKVMGTVGFKITEITNTRGFSMTFSAATTVLLASKLGMPVSTTHALVGAVMGVGLARGMGSLDFKVIKNIFTSWMITLPVAAFTAAGIFIIARSIFF